mmetsp:Transcript_6424/g.20828  ORF Transcript_6424/g.20828 Transcript_6424/m.20828 type:complete len:318 (+) Transcript_6424:1149-2102(+)
MSWLRSMDSSIFSAGEYNLSSRKDLCFLTSSSPPDCDSTRRTTIAMESARVSPSCSTTSPPRHTISRCSHSTSDTSSSYKMPRSCCVSRMVPTSAVGSTLDTTFASHSTRKPTLKAARLEKSARRLGGTGWSRSKGKSNLRRARSCRNCRSEKGSAMSMSMRPKQRRWCIASQMRVVTVRMKEPRRSGSFSAPDSSVMCDSCSTMRSYTMDTGTTYASSSELDAIASTIVRRKPVLGCSSLPLRARPPSMKHSIEYPCFNSCTQYSLKRAGYTGSPPPKDRRMKKAPPRRKKAPTTGMFRFSPATTCGIGRFCDRHM